jgi:steroid delta-isomerase-like uncharacterized protein
VPRFVGRLFAGEPVVVLMAELRGASNAKAGASFGGARRIRAAGRGSRRHEGWRTQMSRSQESRNKATLTRFEEALSSGDWELISNTIEEVVAPDALIRTPLPIEATGADLLKEVFRRLHRAFPDLHITIEDLIAEGDKVVVRNTITGTHQGEYVGLPPTGRSITYNEIFIVRFAGSRIVETWGVVDVLSQLRQLGALPATS